MDEYRSVVDLAQGPRLFGLEFTLTRSQEAPVRPVGRARLRLGRRALQHGPRRRAEKARLRFQFRLQQHRLFQRRAFVRQPGRPGGFDEQSFDIHRRTLSAGLDLFPGGHFIPYLAFDRNSGSGSGVETWVQDSNNEYAVPTLLSDSIIYPIYHNKRI